MLYSQWQSGGSYRPQTEQMPPIGASRPQLHAHVWVVGAEASKWLPDCPHGYGLQHFSSMFQVYQALRAHLYLQRDDRPLWVISDWELPDGDALLLQSHLLTLPGGEFIPFVVFAAGASTRSLQHALRQGVDDCYADAVPFEELKTRLDFLTEHKIELDKQRQRPQPHDTFHLPAGKRVADIIIAGLVLIASSPLWLIIASVLKLRQGWVLQKETRVGSGYGLFTAWRFEAEAESMDRWLLRSRLAFLPRWWQVLTGDLSMVGNRALPLAEAELLTTDEWARRFLAPAGLTGPWRLAPQGASEAEKRGLEVIYAGKGGFWYDLKVLWQTAWGKA